MLCASVIRIMFSHPMDLVSTLTSELYNLGWGSPKPENRETRSKQRHCCRTLQTFMQPQLPFGVPPVWALAGRQEGTATRRDAPARPSPSLPAPAILRLPTADVGSAAPAQTWAMQGPPFHGFGPVYTPVFSQQTKVPADSTQESVYAVPGTYKSNKTHGRLHRTQLDYFTLPVNVEHMYHSMCNLWKFNTQKPPCQDNAEEKQNHCCYNPVFISTNLPSKPPVLQAVFYHTVHKEEEKKV